MLADADAFMPPLDLGPEVDLWLANRNIEAGELLRYLQAFLYAPHVSDFTRLLGQPGSAELRTVDAEYLWSLLSARFVDDDT